MIVCKEFDIFHLYIYNTVICYMFIYI